MELTEALKKWINFKKNQQLRTKAIIALAEFLFLMLILTFVSRAVYSSFLPMVSVTDTKRMALTHKVSLDGVVENTAELAMFVEDGLLVKEVCAVPGDRVEIGSPLFVFDTEDLQEQILAQKNTIAKLQLEITDLQSARCVQNQADALDKSRSREDYTDTANEQNSKVSQANSALNNAKNEKNQMSAMDTYVATAVSADEKYQEYQKKISDLETRLAAANQAAGSSAGSTVSSNDTASSLQAQLTQARNESSAYEASLRETAKAQWEEKVAALSANVTDLEQAYAQILAGQKSALKSAGREIQDADLEKASNHSLEVEQITLQEEQKKLHRLEELAKANGIFTSTQAGTITKSDIAAGVRTPVDGSLLLAGDNRDLQFSTQASLDQLKYLPTNSEVSIQLYGSQRSLNHVTVDRVERNEMDSKTYDVYVTVSGNDAKPGQAGALEASTQSENFGKCIPLSAILDDNGVKYVYVVQKRATILGEEWKIVKREVTVLDSNDAYAAIESAALQEGEQIVTGSSKEIKEGVTVRPMEE